jgi:signal transduction histidine kinase
MTELERHAISLRWQLVSRVALVLACLMVVVNIGFFIFILLWQPYAKQADKGVIPEIVQLLKGVGGRLEINGDGALGLRRNFPDLWFAAVTDQGSITRYGDIPFEFESLLPRLSGMKVLDARDIDDPRYTTDLTEVAVDGEAVHLLYGGRVPDEPRYMTLIKGLWIIYVPFTLAPVLIVFLAIPTIVGTALSGVAKTTARAAVIDARSLGVRLPKEDVVLELHPLVDAVNAALTRIDDDVSRRQRFLTNAAHELRTPIAILQTRIETQAPGPARERLLLDVRRLAATAEQLLDIQRFSTIQTWDDVDLVKLCETVAADIAPIALAAGYEIAFDTEIADFTVKGDVASLERAVTNLAINAVEHGGGRGRITVEVLRDGTIEVADEGPGIPADQMKKVFEPFYRVVPKSTGAGLGLSLVHQIAQSHDGHVSIVEQARGARFRLIVGKRA